MIEAVLSQDQVKRIKQKGSWFIGSTHSPLNMLNIQKNITNAFYYAYIIHDKDEGKTPHIHFILNVSGSRSIKSIAEMLDTDYQDVQICKTDRGSTRYLIHIDDKDKYQYSFKEIITNDSDRTKKYFKDEKTCINDLYNDFVKLRIGEISKKDFVEKYSPDFSQMPFYQKIKTLEVIERIGL